MNGLYDSSCPDKNTALDMRNVGTSRSSVDNVLLMLAANKSAAELISILSIAGLTVSQMHSICSLIKSCSFNASNESSDIMFPSLLTSVKQIIDSLTVVIRSSLLMNGSALISFCIISSFSSNSVPSP